MSKRQKKSPNIMNEVLFRLKKIEEKINKIEKGQNILSSSLKRPSYYSLDTSFIIFCCYFTSSIL
jgi:hypothetical protein